MKLLDYVKALGVALLVLVLNTVVAIVVVLGYSMFVNPGQPSEYYTKVAPTIVPLYVHIASPFFFFGAGYLFARRRPDRNGLLFATAVVVAYVVIDSAMVAFKVDVEFAMWMVLNLVAALAGAMLPGRKGKVVTN